MGSLDPGACAYRPDNVSLKPKIFGEGSETAAALDVSLSATPAERKACHELAHGSCSHRSHLRVDGGVEHVYCQPLLEEVAGLGRRSAAVVTMKVLVVGAGVIGSFNAARLVRGGVDVTLLARGERLAVLHEHGVVLEDWRTRWRSVTPVPLVDRIEQGSNCDLALVIVRRNQIASVLPLLAAAPRIPSVAFVGNNLAGSSDMAAALWAVSGC